MSKGIIVILILVIAGNWACDTTSNIAQLNDSFFIKLYAGVEEGNQFGNDIITTSDGGLLIAGTSESTSTNAKEILLIKTDDKGNELWTYGSSIDFGPSSISEAKSVIELTNSYLVGGTIIENSLRKSILLEIDFNGTLVKYVTIATIEAGVTKYNTLSKISKGLSGIMICGETDHVAGLSDGGINGYITVYDESTLMPIPEVDTIQYFGLGGDDHVVGGYEVNDPMNSIGGDSTRYLIFGHSDLGNVGDDSKYYYAGYPQFFSTQNPNITATFVDNIPGNQSASYVTQFNDTYWVIGNIKDVQEQMFLVGWEFKRDLLKNVDWSTVQGSGLIPTNDAVIGKGVSVQAENKYVIVGDNVFTAEHSEIYLAKVSRNFRIDSPPWPKTYGTSTSAYTASAVTTFQDGSIIMVGTADLQPIKKIIVIKTGPNGEMSF